MKTASISAPLIFRDLGSVLPTKISSQEVAGDDWFDLSPEGRRSKAQSTFGLEIHDHLEDYEVTQQVFEKLVEEHTFNPCFVTHVDSKLIPLAKGEP